MGCEFALVRNAAKIGFRKTRSKPEVVDKTYRNKNLLDDLDTPELRQTIQLMFSDIYPMQEALLGSIDHFLKEDSLQLADLLATLKIRAMDSVLYAGVIDQVIREYQSPEGDASMKFNQLYQLINATLQINDLVDAIVYAKQDLASKSATIVEIIRRIDATQAGIDNTIKNTFEHLKINITTDPESGVRVFVDKLVGITG